MSYKFCFVLLFRQAATINIEMARMRQRELEDSQNFAKLQLFLDNGNNENVEESIYSPFLQAVLKEHTNDLKEHDTIRINLENMRSKCAEIISQKSIIESKFIVQKITDKQMFAKIVNTMRESLQICTNGQNKIFEMCNPRLDKSINKLSKAVSDVDKCSLGTKAMLTTLEIRTVEKDTIQGKVCELSTKLLEDTAVEEEITLLKEVTYSSSCNTNSTLIYI